MSKLISTGDADLGLQVQPRFTNRTSISLRAQVGPEKSYEVHQCVDPGGRADSSPKIIGIDLS